jgi:hypothetical protein
MTKRRLYLVLQAAVCAALAVLLSISAVSIYREGSARKAENPMESIYTPEAVSEKLVFLAPLFFAGAGLLIAGLVLDLKDEDAEKPVKDAETGRDLAVSRVSQPSESMLTERRNQNRLLWTGRCLSVLCMIPLLIWLLNPAHFPEADPEGMFRSLLRVLMPCTAAALGSLTVTRVLREKSLLREMKAAQERLKEERAAGTEAPEKDIEQPGRSVVPQAVLIVAAVALILAGVLNGSARNVLYKAITICTECVGLG